MRRYFVGNGVDIGGLPDPLCLYGEFFPLMGDVKIWDLADGDAQFMQDVPDDHYDFVHSSHCLEHLNDPTEGLANWLRITKPGGYVVVLVPDEDLYEQGHFPSTYNRDHKHTFTIYKQSSWSNRSVNLVELLADLGPSARVEKIELLCATYRYDLPRYDQTATPIGESAIEFIVRKAAPEEGGSDGSRSGREQPSERLRVYYNQYRDDLAALRKANDLTPPFQNEDPL